MPYFTCSGNCIGYAVHHSLYYYRLDDNRVDEADASEIVDSSSKFTNGLKIGILPFLFIQFPCRYV